MVVTREPGIRPKGDHRLLCMGLFSTFWREPEFGSEACLKAHVRPDVRRNEPAPPRPAKAAALGTTLPPAKFHAKIQEAKSL